MDTLRVITMERRRSKIIDWFRDYWEKIYRHCLIDYNSQKQAMELGFVSFCSSL